MRASRQRPASQHGAQPLMQAIAHPPRKIFNCIVDDTALVAGVKKSTRNGIRQWVKNGQIRLFVPLHALEQLRRQTGGQNRHGEDVLETLKWLDDATSRYPHAVTLQGGDQFYQEWAEVERFAVPRTLFSESDHVDDHGFEPEPDMLSEETATKLTLSDSLRKSSVSSVASFDSQPASPLSLQSMHSSASPVSPPTSPNKAVSSPLKPLHNATPPMPASATVPLRLQPLFNYILWRIHQELDPIAALESFIFLCNDANKACFAKGFDVRTKRLEQLREAVGREDRDYRNRLQMQSKENQSTPVPTTPMILPDADGEVVYQPRVPRGPAAMMQQPARNVIDPNAFGRTPQIVSQSAQPDFQPRSPHQPFSHTQSQPGRGGPPPPFAPRGNGRGKFRGPPRGRGNLTPGRGAFNSSYGAPRLQPNGQIDPDSFTRPRSSGFTGRGGRRLWTPT